MCQANPEMMYAPIVLIFLAIFALIGFIVFLFKLFLWWRIFSKAGYSGALALLMLIPGLGELIIICVLAFSTWPITKTPPLPQQQPV
jgi:uncharacterized membrane protein YhaH (DUF805 family)